MTTTKIFNAIQYYAEDINEHISAYHMSPLLKGGVFPGVLEDLQVIGGRGGGVSILPGAAMVGNYIYYSDEIVSVAVMPNNEDYVRIDYLVLRANAVTQEIHPEIIVNVANGYYVLKEYNPLYIYAETNPIVNVASPTINTNSLTPEIVLAIITVPPNTTFITNANVKDERCFLINSIQNQSNRLKNSEFYAYSTISTTQAPEMWSLSGVATTLSVSAVTQFFLMSRGNYVTIENALLQQSFKSLYDTFKPNTINNVFSVTGTLQGNSSTASVKMEALDIFENVLETWEEQYELTGEYIQTCAVVRFKDVIGLHHVRFSVGSISGAVYVGQYIVTAGYIPTFSRPFREAILLRTPITDTNYTADTFSTSTATVALSAAFGGKIDTGVQEIILRVIAKDSGSAAAAAGSVYVGIAHTSTSPEVRLQLAGVANNVEREIQITVHVDNFTLGGTTPSFYLNIAASGAASLTLTLQIVGVIV